MLTRPTPRPAAAARLAASPVAELAEAAGIEVLQPARPREPEFLDRLAELGAGLLPGRRLRRADAQARARHPAHGWVNLHFSLLPAWRGAAPVQHAMLAGDEITGATTFLLEAGPRHRPGVRP